MQLPCHIEDRSALLQFKESFIINKSASPVSNSYPKVASWTLGHDCCSWDGITCDEITGHVIGVDLSNSYLHGSINSSSSIFRLIHLQELNLAFNDFNYSQIPSTVGNLSKLTYLNLSDSLFFGEVPSEISMLSKLSVLDLSYNFDSSYAKLLEFKEPSVDKVLQNLTHLEYLHLAYVNIYSSIPNTIANLSSLKSLYLSDCGLYGEFPKAILQLPNLQFLQVPHNPSLVGHLPESQWGNRLKSLWVTNTSFSGHLPTSIGNLHSLEVFDISYCEFVGAIPSSLGNLTQLVELNLRVNSLTLETPSSLANLTHLTYLSLYGINIAAGGLSWLDNLTKLNYLCLQKTDLHGNISSSFSKLTQLAYLDLATNQFTGEIPSFLANLTQLAFLDVADNQLTGQLPSWIMNLSQLIYLRLGSNKLQGSIPISSISGLKKLVYLSLRSNKFQGPLPIPASSILLYSVSNNSLTGEIPDAICKLTSLKALDLSNNILSGKIPPCMGNLSNSLFILNLDSNNLSGGIPQIWTNGSKLKIINLGQNKLHGRIPLPLANCMMLESLDLGNNQLDDTFPLWLGALPRLKRLILRSNNLHGVVGRCKSDSKFPSLRSIDISSNNLTGELPSQCFLSWNAMKADELDHLTNMEVDPGVDIARFMFNDRAVFPDHYDYLMVMADKGGIKMNYEKVIEFFTANDQRISFYTSIDLSCNKFQGDIPEIIGNLKGLHFLNLSNNILSGSIPSSIGSIANIRKLDLSQNMLSGQIPHQLAKLTFLETFNVSYNHLTGPVPKGYQFDLLEKNSFDGNPGLCGKPLPKKCENLDSSLFHQGEDSDSLFQFEWKMFPAGCGFGLVIGILMGHLVFTKKRDFFLKTFGLNRSIRQRHARRASRARRN
uniref:LRR-RLK n=1 Tax=Vernicia montana TaxID=316732 RepID=A0A140G4I2_9ROSI|nr:LRR-RLK [Vernicia montana]